MSRTTSSKSRTNGSRKPSAEKASEANSDKNSRSTSSFPYKVFHAGELTTRGDLQPRQTLDEAQLESLVQSIVSEGIIEPLIVRPNDGYHEIVCGHRRYEAGLRAGLKKFPAIVRDLHDGEALLVSLQENIQRSSLNTIEEAATYRRLLDAKAVNNQKDLAKRIGVTPARVSQKLACLAMPTEIQEMLTRVNSGPNPFTEHHARILRAIENHSKQVELAREACQQGWSVKHLEDRINELIKKSEKSTPSRTRRTTRTKWLRIGKQTRYLKTRKGLRVEIEGRNQEMVIEQLEHLLMNLRHERCDDG